MSDDPWSGPYKTILVDPPWRFQWAKRRGGCPYDCLDTSTLIALPISSVCHRDSVLLLWAT